MTPVIVRITVVMEDSGSEPVSVACTVTKYSCNDSQSGEALMLITPVKEFTTKTPPSPDKIL